MNIVSKAELLLLSGRLRRLASIVSGVSHARLWNAAGSDASGASQDKEWSESTFGDSEDHDDRSI